MSPASSSATFDISADGTAWWSDEDHGPTQAQLAVFANTHREKLSSLSINVEHGIPHPTLDFEDIGLLPALTSLLLGGVYVSALVFTTANTPALRTLKTWFLSCSHDDGLRFELALPQLRTFDAEYVVVNGPCNFGLSLSRCPQLETVRAYKFRFLSGDNFVVLPACTSFELYRSECTDSLEVLYAPKLEALSVEASYDLGHLRLWDLPQVSTKDVELLVKELEEKTISIGEEVHQWVKNWKDGTFTGQDAYDLHWIEREDVADFNFNTHPYIEEVMSGTVQEMFDKKRAHAKRNIWIRFVERVAQRPEIHSRESLPRCEVNIVNMSLSKESSAHLRANKRVSFLSDPDDLGERGFVF